MADNLPGFVIADRLSGLVDHARALELAIAGAHSINSRERDALAMVAGLLAEAIAALHGELGVEPEAAREGQP